MKNVWHEFTRVAILYEGPHSKTIMQLMRAFAYILCMSQHHFIYSCSTSSPVASDGLPASSFLSSSDAVDGSES